MPFLDEIGPAVLEKILLFRYYFPLERDTALHFNKLESPSPKDASFAPSLVKIGPVVLENKMKM